MKMPFGKHAGQDVSELETEYLLWLLKNIERMRPDLRACVRLTLILRGVDVSEFGRFSSEELHAAQRHPFRDAGRQRGADPGQRPPPPGGSGGNTSNGSSGWPWGSTSSTGTRPPPPPPPPVGLDRAAVERLVADAIGAVRRKMAIRHHPDRGGDVKVMSAVNDALDLVLKELKR